MRPKTPKAIKNGHENLYAELESIVELEGRIGENAKFLLEIMSAHFKKEEEYALPPLGFLLTLSEGGWEFDPDDAIRMSEKLRTELSELTKEHIDILSAAQELKIIAEEENNLTAKQFVKDLKLHADIEDQVLYPATILIGEYLKNLKAN